MKTKSSAVIAAAASIVIAVALTVVWWFGKEQSKPLASVPSCGTVKMGDFDWNSAKLHSAIAGYILKTGYGCNVEVTTGSTLPIMTGLYNGELDVVMEVWYDNIVDQFKPYEDKGVVKRIGVNTPDSGQGFYVDGPTARKHGITSVDDMLKPEIAMLFQDPENDSKGRMTSCISGWSCYTINLVKHHSYGLDQFYTNYDPGSSGALDAAIKGAFQKQQPIFTYYWEPTALMGMVDLVKLEEPAYEQGTWDAMMVVVNDIKANGIEKLVKVDATAYRDMELPVGINTRLEREEPAVADFMSHYTISSADLSKLLVHYLDKDQADGEAELTARHFLTTSSGWESWVPADVAQKVKDSL